MNSVSNKCRGSVAGLLAILSLVCLGQSARGAPTVPWNDDVSSADVSVYNFITAAYAVGEGNMTATYYGVSLARTGGVALAASVDVALESGSATAGIDFTAGPVTVNFDIGETNKAVPIEILGDLTVELDEVINLSLTNFINGAAGTNQPTATLTITNDDSAIFNVESAAAFEDGDPVISDWNDGTTQGWSLPVTDDGGWVLGGDVDSGYVYYHDGPGAGNGPMLHAPSAYLGDWSRLGTNGTLEFDFSILNAGGGIDSGTSVTIGNGVDTRSYGWALNTGHLGVWTHVSIPLEESAWSGGGGNWDDIVSNVTELYFQGDRVSGNFDEMAFDNVALNGATSMVFTVSLTAPVDVATSVDVSTVDGTAQVSDSDYIPLSGHTLNFAAGVTTQTFGVWPTPDTTTEASEVFSAVLSGVSSGGRAVTASAGSGVGMILNDDGAALSISDVTVTENSGGTTTAVFVVRLDGTVPGGVAVQFTVSNGTARAEDGDYDSPQTSGIVFGGFDAARGGDYSLASGSAMAGARATILASFPGCSFTEASALTTAYLDSIDILVISSVKNDSTAIDPLLTSERSALQLFVAAGGGAVLFVDNDSFGGTPTSDIANESLLEVFDLDVTGSLTTASSVGTITNPTHPVTDGIFGTVGNFRGNRMGYFDRLGSYATSLGTWDQNGQPGVAVIEPSVISAGSGAVVLMADVSIAADRLSQQENEELLLNSVAYVTPSDTINFVGVYGETQTIEITVNDDADPETTEFFSVHLFNAVASGGTVTIVDNLGIGYIVDDDAVLMDYGDLPVAYGITRLQDDGARHYVGGPYLGTAIDEEINGQEGLYADIDDLAGTDDEDGITPVGLWSAGVNGARIQVVVSGGGGYLSGWIDWNGDNDFNDTAEHVLDMRPVTLGTQTVAFPVPSGAISHWGPQVDYARFRITGSALPQLAVTGLAANGEVEDYYLIYSGNPTPIHYAWTNSPAPAPPYTSWATAAHVLQDAIDAADAYDTVLVTNGVYDVGARVVHGSMANRIVVGEAVTVRSVNGPASVIIAGQPGSGGSNGVGAVRCAYLNWGAVLAGVTLSNGYTLVDGSAFEEQSGGGAWCVSSATLSNCVVTANGANCYGAGVYAGHLVNCVVTGNRAGDDGGGAWHGTASGCTFSDNTSGDDGGGTFSVAAIGCTYGGNRAAQEGGGAHISTMTDCTVTGNSAYSGGGASGCIMTNCTLSANVATAAGGGAYAGVLTECVVTNNAARHGGGVANLQAVDSVISYNRASDHGGGANMCVLVDCIVGGNMATNNAGGIYEGTTVRCLVTGNTAGLGGGGTYYGVAHDSTISLNEARVGAGARYTTLYGCTIVGNTAVTTAGGAQQSVLHRCRVQENSAYLAGGIYQGKAYNCLITGNTSTTNAGGAGYSLLLNCTVSDNAAGGNGGGTYAGHLINCIVYYNSPDNTYTSDCAFTCTTPVPVGGVGNIGGSPMFINPGTGNYRLSGLSPCIDAGTNLASGGSVGGEGGAYTAVTVDLDGRDRPLGGAYDMGAYELNPADVPVGPNAMADVDGDGANGWEEFVAGTDADNLQSYPHISNVDCETGFNAYVESRAGRLYSLEWCATPRGVEWHAVSGQQFVPGTGEMLILSDPGAGAVLRFYRVRVDLP